MRDARAAGRRVSRTFRVSSRRRFCGRSRMRRISRRCCLRAQRWSTCRCENHGVVAYERWREPGSDPYEKAIYAYALYTDPSASSMISADRDDA